MAAGLTKLKGYRYFQIVSPDSLSNVKGFPINNLADIVSYVSPRASNVYGLYTQLENSKITHSSIDVPTFSGDPKFKIQIRLVKNPKYYEIVWDVNNFNNLERPKFQL